MKKVLLLLLIPILAVFISCSGLLWNGTPGYSGEKITISIDNPFYQGGEAAQQSSKALALQGQYLYIELAKIDDQALYNADTDKAVSGNGTWIETAWGGHAILTFDLNSWTETLEATFQGVPRGEALKARALLETSETDLVTGIEGYYGEGSPICMTLDTNAPDIFEPVGTANRLDTMWVTIPVVSLAEGVLSLPIRPEGMNYYPATIDLSTKIFKTYIDPSGIGTTTEIEPAVGNTKFSSFELDLSSDYLRNPVIYITVDSTLAVNPGILALYDEDGALLAIESEVSTSAIQTIQLDLDSTYSKSMFVGATILEGTPALTEDNPLYSGQTYNVGFGVLHDGNLSITHDNSDLYTSTMALPPGVHEGDIEFQIINLSPGAIALTDIDTLDKINGFKPFSYDSNWANTYITWSTGASFDSFYFIDPGYDPPTNSWVIILARFPGGEAFIFGRAQSPPLA